MSESETLSLSETEKIRVQRKIDDSWANIFAKYNLFAHDFAAQPFYLTAPQIKAATNNQEPRILCKRDTRESCPTVFRERGLFILPITNGTYVIVKGEGYFDIPPITDTTKVYASKLGFELDTAKVGNSEMQHLDFAYASSLVRTFLQDESLVLTIRGRKYTPEFSFRVGTQEIKVKSVQTEVDAGYEGRGQVALIEAKSAGVTNTIIRQMFYPLRQWRAYTRKKVITLFFEKSLAGYSFWEFEFADETDYNSIQLVKSSKYEIV